MELSPIRLQTFNIAFYVPEKVIYEAFHREEESVEHLCLTNPYKQ